MLIVILPFLSKILVQLLQVDFKILWHDQQVSEFDGPDPVFFNRFFNRYVWHCACPNLEFAAFDHPPGRTWLYLFNGLFHFITMLRLWHICNRASLSWYFEPYRANRCPCI